jgi:Fe-S oxidoreductase
MVAAGLAATLAGWTIFGWRVASFLGQFAAARPELAGSRTDQPWLRTRTMLREFLGHRQLLAKPLVAAAHWATMISFLVLVPTLAQATGQLLWPDFVLPLLGHWAPYGWLTEAFAWLGLGGIAALAIVRLAAAPRAAGRSSRFLGSHQGRARYVEATIAAVVVCVLALRALEAELLARQGGAVAWYFPLTGFLRGPLSSLDQAGLAWWVSGVALAKIVVSYAWMVVVGLTPTMGVAWHRFSAFVTLWTAKNPDGSPALGALDPIIVDGAAVDLADPDEQVWERLGARTAAELTWRDQLALATCTECGRCQGVCPAWGAGKSLSPKLMIQTLRDNVASGSGEPLVGARSLVSLAPEDLWACTTCGACVAACPVQVEHVDLIADLRRGKVLVDADFPTELGGVFRNLERRANPWGMPTRDRLEWARDLGFTVPVLGEHVASLHEVDYLYWVGCAGAFNQRGARTARALAELLHRARVRFAVLGEAEKCCGDPARRAGNEVLFSSLAGTNAAALEAAHATRIVVTCAHCYNTLRAEYGPFGGRYDVIHHTQLLAQLINEGKLNLSAAHCAGRDHVVTFHDPCYLARHSGETTAPRAVLKAVPGVQVVEMPRHGAQTSCCGAGGCRVWLEEDPDHRMSSGRASEARCTGATTVVSACPHCAIMLDDAMTAVGLEIVDIASVVLEAVTRDTTP